ncbi:hypothetical protein STVIR_7553 [Streptomyces viridochromogenes Tue57]|uniref:Uncharacterized protein n=1 Tax=Streptomyces viridochromogenes Tue57 TaxID=1160705 RepID=L8P4X4_STRVR|nr:hypothetical protein STVIR_7553 [Streptomyces viridochromogenes Tue57]
MLVENLEVQLIRPPVPVCPRPSRRGGRGGDCWVLAFAAGHVRPSFCLVVCTHNADDCEVSASVWSRTAHRTATKHAEQPPITKMRVEAAFLLPRRLPAQAEIRVPGCPGGKP